MSKSETPETIPAVGQASELPSGKILIVDDETYPRMILKEAVQQMGYSPEEASDGQNALERLRYGNFDLMLTDMNMPGMDGLTLLSNTLKADPGVSVIVVTAHGTIETAVEAMRKGAEDFITKPVEIDNLKLTLERVFKKRTLLLENKRLLSENEALREDLKIRYHLATAVGRSQEAVLLVEKINLYMKTRTHTLVTGEPGSGQIDVAKTLHYNSPWAGNPILFFDCFTVPEHLQEAHLFGEEGSTQPGSAKKGVPGLIERAQSGSIVISSVHRLNAACQARLSRVIREEKTQRVGGSRFYPVHLKVITTSYVHDFEAAVNAGAFKRDFYEVLCEHEIRIPALRERIADVPLLIAATARRVGQSLGKEIEKIDKSVIDLMSLYSFPGNLRELEGMVETAVIRCTGTRLQATDFSFPKSLS